MTDRQQLEIWRRYLAKSNFQNAGLHRRRVRDELAEFDYQFDLSDETKSALDVAATAIDSYLATITISNSGDSMLRNAAYRFVDQAERMLDDVQPKDIGFY